MTPDETQDYVRRSVDSSIQALTNIVREIQVQQKEHRENEIESRTVYREEMLNAVEKKIQVVVNGKIDRIADSIQTMQDDVTKVKSDVNNLQPMYRQYTNTQGFWATISAHAKNLALIVGFIGGLGILVGYLLKLYGK